MRRLILPALSVIAVVFARTAMADATVSVGDPGRFAPPPTPYRPPVLVVAPPPPGVDEPPVEVTPRERYRAPFRLSVGPTAFTSGQGLGMGVGVAADFGTGTVGARLAAAWLRGEKQGTPDEATSATGAGMGQYTGEVTIDFHKRGPLHPVFGLGVGVAHVFRPGMDAFAGIGTARLALEYAFGFDDADVRLSLGVLGALPGPAAKELEHLKGWGMIGASIAVGF